MRDRDMKYFDVARSMAKLSTWSEIPREQVGSVIVLRNEIIATGYNRRKTNPLQFHFSQKVGRPEAIYPHAEIAALHKFKKQHWLVHEFHLMKIFVFRETKNGMAMARPCEICTEALKSFGIKHVFYTTPDGYAEEIWE